jgi:hypothetical protein
MGTLKEELEKWAEYGENVLPMLRKEPKPAADDEAIEDLNRRIDALLNELELEGDEEK